MSFGTYARRVRNEGLPYGLRYSALRCAVGRYHPLGFRVTWGYLMSRAGPIRSDESALLGALGMLETSRQAWLAEIAEFARRRRADKYDRHAVSADEHRYRYGRRWPGPDGHDAMHHAVEVLWAEHVPLPFPEVPAADKGDLALLDSTIAGCVSAYLGRRGVLEPGHRDIVRRCVTDLRAVSLGYPMRFPEASAYFRRLTKMAEIMAHDALPLVRRGWSGDAGQLGEIFLAARRGMRYLPRLHTDEETRQWIATVMRPGHEVWVAELHGRPVGFAALRGHRLEHLYVTPDAQRLGIGTALLAQAERTRPQLLSLRVFQQNTGARDFYERHGFTLVELGDGGDNEENLPDAEYRWRAIDEPRRPQPIALNDSMTCAFPSELADDVRAVTGLMPPSPHRARSGFRVTVGDDRVVIPSRIHHDELAPETLRRLSPTQQAIAHCLYTRHHDGHVRQRHLALVIGSLQPWIIPFVVRLVGEYVVEIVADIHRELTDLNRPGSPVHSAYGRFAAHNPAFVELTDQQVAGYWSCYYRHIYSRSDYPGQRLIIALRDAANTASTTF